MQFVAVFDRDVSPIYVTCDRHMVFFGPEDGGELFV
jgi:hypothetical protein